MSLAAESGALTESPILQVRDVVVYHLADDLTGGLLCCIMVFSPWAFGTTEPWSIWTMRVCGYTLGLLFGVKCIIRRAKDYRPARWGDLPTAPRCQEASTSLIGRMPGGALPQMARGFFDRIFLTRVLAGGTLLLLSYCLIAVVNARAGANPVSGVIEYRSCIGWLPHSFDRKGSWDALWSYLALACSFWATRDWLLGKSGAELRAGASDFAGWGRGAIRPVPVRLRTLLWVLSVSGGLLALEGIIQRLTNSPRLLFLISPGVNQSAETQFASYAYRANAAQYFNLLWPVSLGFWWTMFRPESHELRKCALLACAGLMAICPIVSGARGAALVDCAMLIITLSVLLISLARDNGLSQRAKRRISALLGLSFAGVLAIGLGIGWRQMRPRISHFKEDLQERERLYEIARRVAQDFPVFGTGPGTFERVFQVYRRSPEAYWPAQLHNDWLETRVTFGWVGCVLIALSLCVILAAWVAPGGIRLGRQFPFFLGLSLAGCLVQARWDFPLQVYSILFLFVVWCALMVTLSGDLLNRARSRR